MAPPPVTIYVTSLTSQPKVRKYMELLHRSLKGLEIPYEAYDLVIDEQAKTRWQRAKPPGMVVGLPGYLVGGEWVGTMEDFEDAVETGTLPTFLKQDIDLGDGSSASNTNKSGTIAEHELEKLMREMTEGDLDKLAGEIGVDPDVGKVGLLSESKPAPTDTTTTTTTMTPSTSTAGPSSTLTSTPPSASPSSSAPSKTAPLMTSEPSRRSMDGPATSPLPPLSASRKNSLINPVERKGSRVSMEEKAEVAREMMEAGTVDGLMKAVEKAEGKEKLD